ncbi:venom protease-like [Homalodisca vitripennis]|uniref:venom protease-like n=1 Tax=Homalodisca vitripennis TaxID=197043 RepID=UPI001EECE215|nr:venom protease-like [Homalodisca vitripennis]
MHDDASPERVGLTEAKSKLLLVGVNICVLAALQEVDSTAASKGVNYPHKRQVGDDLCFIPETLTNGLYSSHERRCPPGDNSAACRLVPGVPVSAGWIIQYRCHPGFRLNTTRVASICLQRQGGARWLPPLPSCLESSYNSRFLPSRFVCGKSSHHRTKRRVDGKVSSRGEWPWMVIFGHSKSADPKDGIHWFCAGTLITTRHIITAANCVAAHRRRPAVFLARLDDLNLDDTVPEGVLPIEISIEKNNIIIYPGFQPNVVFTHNIALVKLKFDLRITNSVRPICLPTPDFKERSFTGETVYFTSWGQTDDDNERNPKRKRRFEPVLHEISGQVIDQEMCSINYQGYQTTDTPYIISEELICAAVAVNKSCQGDIGSPLMLKHDGNFFLLGIVATDYRCFDEYYPRLFTKLSLYMDWIVANLKF